VPLKRRLCGDDGDLAAVSRFDRRLDRRLHPTKGTSGNVRRKGYSAAAEAVLQATTMTFAA
jgi:hypothetical protein